MSIFRRGPDRRRLPWKSFTVVGVLGLAGWWMAPSLIDANTTFRHLSLGDKDSVSSVISMVAGLVSLVIALVFGLLQLRQGRPSPAVTPGGSREQHAADRLSVHLGRGDGLRHINDRRTSALALRVHPTLHDAEAQRDSTGRRWRQLVRHPHPTDGDLSLPRFVERDQEEAVREWMRSASTQGGFLILMGKSCVGKTRLLYETARTELAGFTVLAPDLGDGELVNSIATAKFRLPKLIVWLDELQRFLPGPFLTDASVPITAAAVRHLLDGPTPVIILGTLWPDYAATLRADAESAGAQALEPGAPRARYPEAVDILTQRRVHQIRIDGFTATERTAATRLAATDHRLALAVADRDYNVTEALAGAREIMDRYQRATDDQRAVLHAAVDARRVGLQSPLGRPLLLEAARGYLTTVHPDDAWFSRALTELTSKHRPQDRAAAPLLEIPSDDHRSVVGYTITDYLHQRLNTQRRIEPLPDPAWRALTEHASKDDLGRLTDNAVERLRLQDATAICRRRIVCGDRAAVDRLADLRGEPDHVASLTERAG